MNDLLNIIALGDMGNGEVNQYKVAEGILELDTKIGIDFVLGLGDNIYPNGVESINDNKFKDQFENPYSILPKNIDFYMTLGNHDYRNRIAPQINYTLRSSRWNMPGRYYQFTKKIKDCSIDFFAIDTNFNSMTFEDISLQEKWLKKSLSESKSKWKIVFGHHPWKSSGYHGDSKGLIDKFYKETLSNKVDILLNGHDHDKQHMIYSNINLIITGTGCQIRQINKENRLMYPYLQFFEESLGYCLLQINKNKIIFYFLDESNNLEYAYEIEKK